MSWIAPTVSLALITVMFVIVLVIVLYALRLRRTAYRAGSFPCELKAGNSQEWTLGTAVYGADRLEWYKLISLSRGPGQSWPRGQMVISLPQAYSGASKDPDLVEVRVDCGGQSCVLGLSSADNSGLVSWSESRPPQALSQ